MLSCVRLLRLHGLEATRLLCPWDYPGKNTGMGCHFLLQNGCRIDETVIQSCLTLCDPADCSPPRLLCPWNSPGKNTGVSSHSLLQRFLPTQGSNLSLSHCGQILYPLSHRDKFLNLSKGAVRYLHLAFFPNFCPNHKISFL